jgi:SAM-dependent methyltransferase
MQPIVGRSLGLLRHFPRAALSDARDWVRGERDPLVPPRHHLYAGWRCDYGRVAGRWVLAAFDVGELTPDGHVLDIGCGPGRIAAPLTRRLEGGSYEGFDIVPRSIRWCQRKISARHPNFRFQVADIRNAEYNPTGSQEARAYSFPYPDREFDLALAASVFTHMVPGEVERYVSEVARVLKPGGRLLASFYLMNEEAEMRLAASRRWVLGEEQRDGGVTYRSSHPAAPKGPRGVANRVLTRPDEQMIVVFERDVREMYAGAGLEVESVRYGKWCGRPDAYLGYSQDLVVARRR